MLNQLLRRGTDSSNALSPNCVGPDPNTQAVFLTPALLTICLHNR